MKMYTGSAQEAIDPFVPSFAKVYVESYNTSAGLKFRLIHADGATAVPETGALDMRRIGSGSPYTADTAGLPHLFGFLVKAGFVFGSQDFRYTANASTLRSVTSHTFTAAAYNAMSAGDKNSLKIGVYQRIQDGAAFPYIGDVQSVGNQYDAFNVLSTIDFNSIILATIEQAVSETECVNTLLYSY